MLYSQPLIVNKGTKKFLLDKGLTKMPGACAFALPVAHERMGAIFSTFPMVKRAS